MATPKAEHDIAPPRGVEAVKASLVTAAAELLAAQPASQVSGRAIARRAHVNYGLIHQYFGSKEKIFREVFLQLSDRATAQARNCLLYTSPSPRDLSTSRMPSSA